MARVKRLAVEVALVTVAIKVKDATLKQWGKNNKAPNQQIVGGSAAVSHPEVRAPIGILRVTALTILLES